VPSSGFTFFPFLNCVFGKKIIGVLGSEYDQEQPQRPHGSREEAISLGHTAAVKITASMHIPYLPFARLVGAALILILSIERFRMQTFHESLLSGCWLLPKRLSREAQRAPIFA
jgi:hypothetical protein